MNLTYDELLSNFAFKCNLRHYAVHVLHMLVPQPRGFTALQQLPLEEFRIVMTALIDVSQRRWPSNETGAVEKSKSGAGVGSFFTSGGDTFVPRAAHPMDHSVAEEATMVGWCRSKQPGFRT